jgi:hypothetical protein
LCKSRDLPSYTLAVWLDENLAREKSIFGVLRRLFASGEQGTCGGDGDKKCGVVVVRLSCGTPWMV